MLLASLDAFKNRLHLGALLLVVLLGMIARSLGAVGPRFDAGISVAQRPILRLGVGLLGFQLGVRELMGVGAPALLVVIVTSGFALLVGWWAARLLGLNQKLAILLGVGGSICGASAVVAADTVVQAEDSDAAIAIGVITLLGTAGILIYPALARSLQMSDLRFGVFNGSTLHEMAQVIAAGFGVSDEAGRISSVVKLARICLLAPVVLVLAMNMRAAGKAAASKVPLVPWFLILFVICAVVRSLGLLGPSALDALKAIDLFLLSVGMAGVGLHSGLKDIKRAGVRPVLAGAFQWAFMGLLAFGMTGALRL